VKLADVNHPNARGLATTRERHVAVGGEDKSLVCGMGCHGERSFRTDRAGASSAALRSRGGRGRAGRRSRRGPSRHRCHEQHNQGQPWPIHEGFVLAPSSRGRRRRMPGALETPAPGSESTERSRERSRRTARARSAAYRCGRPDGGVASSRHRDDVRHHPRDERGRWRAGASVNRRCEQSAPLRAARRALSRHEGLKSRYGAAPAVGTEPAAPASDGRWPRSATQAWHVTMRGYFVDR